MSISTFHVNRPLMNGKYPSGRGGTSACYADSKLVVFGGHFYVGDGKFEYSDETWLLDINNCKWHKMSCSGDIPPARYGHTACIIGSRMFVFDLVEWIWIPVSTLSSGPCGRLLHAAEIVGRKIVIHGGWDGSEVFNDLWIFNTDSFAWMQPKTTGFGPTARFGHTMSLTGDGRLIMFGGCSIVKDTGIPRYHDDIRQLDTDTMTWTRPRINGAVPSGRYGHSSLLINGSNIIVFGGWGSLGIQNCDSINNPAAHSFHCLDTTTMTWSVMAQTGKKAIKHVYNHSACISNNIMYVFGGYDGRQASSDFYQVELN